MIEYKSDGDILNDPSDAIVIPVNCVGVMGAGLALAAAKKWPHTEYIYKRACELRELYEGKVIYTWPERKRTPVVVLFPTKRHWRNPSRLEDVESGLADLANRLNRKDGVTSISIPALGCGLGGLRWSDVKPLIEAFAERVPEVRVVVYEPR